MNFVVSHPTHIEIGSTSEDLDAFAQANLPSGSSIRYFIVAGGKATRATPQFAAIVNYLGKADLSFEIAPWISSNPTAEEVSACVEAARRFRAKTILTVGGGSSHDVGKLIAVMVPQTLRLSEITVDQAGYEKISRNVLPTICFPTLAGTGAEISPASLVRIGVEKKIIFSPHMYPSSAYYDTTLICNADRETNLMTGFDAYVQALEAYLSPQANYWSDMLAISGMRDAISGLHDLSSNDSSAEAKLRLTFGAIKGIMAVSKSSVGGIHALSDPLSGRYGVHHGTALSMVASEVIRANEGSAPHRYQVAAALIADQIDPSSGAHDLATMVEQLLNVISPHWRARRISLVSKRADIAAMVAESRNPDMMGNPKELSDDEISNILKKSLLAV